MKSFSTSRNLVVPMSAWMVLRILLTSRILFDSSHAFLFRLSSIRISHREVRNQQGFALDMVSLSSSSSSSSNANRNKVGLASDVFLQEYFNSDISDVNLPPSLSIVRRSFQQLASGSDIRGRYVATPVAAKGARSFSTLAHAIGGQNNKLPALTPFAAHCLGFAFATMVKEEQFKKPSTTRNDDHVVICLGRDPRDHGTILADAFSRGAGGVHGVKVVYTGLATTPALFEFCRYAMNGMEREAILCSSKCDKRLLTLHPPFAFVFSSFIAQICVKVVSSLLPRICRQIGTGLNSLRNNKVASLNHKFNVLFTKHRIMLKFGLIWVFCHPRRGRMGSFAASWFIGCLPTSVNSIRHCDNSWVIVMVPPHCLWRD
jgi:hypothetical protein